jgi:hypothetical protein
VYSLSSGGSGFEPRRRLTSGSLSWLTHFWRRGAVADGMIVMAAAGSKVTFVVAPASYPECLAVAATNCNGKAMARFVTRRISGPLRTGCKCLGGAGRPEDHSRAEPGDRGCAVTPRRPAPGRRICPRPPSPRPCRAAACAPVVCGPRRTGRRPSPRGGRRPARHRLRAGSTSSARPCWGHHPERPESAPALDARALLDRTSSVSLRNTMPRRTGTIRRAPT